MLPLPFHLEIVGRGPERHSLDALSRRLGVSDRVRFRQDLGSDEMAALYRRAQVYLSLSEHEAFGLTLLEAAACGCPVIATTASPLPDLLADAGIYIDPAKPEELEAALTGVLRSESLRLRMREAGIAAARQFTWDAAAQQMMSLIPKVVSL